MVEENGFEFLGSRYCVQLGGEGNALSERFVRLAMVAACSLSPTPLALAFIVPLLLEVCASLSEYVVEVPIIRGTSLTG